MKRIDYVDDVPDGAMLYDDMWVVMTREVFDRLADYTRSQPTGPSPGRIWKRDEHWSGPPANWFVWICWRNDKEYPAQNYMTGRPVLVIDNLVTAEA